MVFLYHGPGAKDNLPKEAVNLTSLDRDSILDFNSALFTPPISSKKNLYSLGPLDNISDRTLETFLKVLEENPEYNDIYLWCHNISSLKDTLISRCQTQWFPGTINFTPEEIEYGNLLAIKCTTPTAIRIALVKDLNLKNVLEVALQKNYTIWPCVRQLFTRETVLPAELVSALGEK